MSNLNLIRLAGATVVVVLGACGGAAADPGMPAGEPASTTTVAPPEAISYDCGVRLPRIEAPVYC